MARTPVSAVASESGPVEPPVGPPDGERPPPEVSPGPWAQRLIPIAMASALFMEFVDSTALSTALPTLARAFHSDPLQLKLALTSYLLALAVVAPASGWVADRFGAKRVFLIAMMVFLAGSAFCGLSHTLGQLVAGRLIQGTGGAMMTPVGRLIVVNSAPRERFVAAMGWFTMPALVGPLVGPSISGLILSIGTWPMIFFVNLPIGLLGMAAVVRFVPKLRQPPPGPFDVKGFAWSAVGVTALIALAEIAGLSLVPPWIALAVALTGAVSLAVFVRHSLTTERPILNLRLLAYPTYRASLLGGSLMRLGIGATPLLLPLLLQLALGWSPAKAGVVTVFQTLGVLAFKPVAPQVIRRLGFRSVLLWSVAGVWVSCSLPAAFRPYTPVPAIVLVLAISGLMRSTQFTAANTLAYAEIPRSQVSQASTLATVVQQVGMSLGVSFGALVLHLTRGGDGALTPDRFVIPFVMVGLTALLALPVYWRLPKDAGDAISGNRRPDG